MALFSTLTLDVPVRPTALFSTLTLDVPVRPMDAKGLIRVAQSEVLDGVGLLRILGVGVGIFDPTLTPQVQFNYFSTCFACLFLLAAQASSSWALL